MKINPIHIIYKKGRQRDTCMVKGKSGIKFDKGEYQVQSSKFKVQSSIKEHGGEVKIGINDIN